MRLFSRENIVKVFKTVVPFLLFVLGPLVANAAALSISPSSGNFEVGNRVVVKVIATSNTPFNAVSGLLSFPSAVFSVESVSKAGSILDFWVTQPTVSKTANTIRFEGVALGGFPGSSGAVVTINLRAINPGTGNFSFQSGQILANDGEGTDITGNLIGATFSVQQATVKPKTPEPKPEVIPEEIQPEPTLRAPEIALGAKYGAQAIVGTSEYPGAQALLTFVATDGTKIFILGEADLEGEFTLLVPSSLRRGTYNVTAVLVKADKTNSETSNMIIVKIGNILDDVGWEISLLILLLILLILYLLLRIHFHLGQDLDKNIKHEIHDAENVVHKSFDILREDIIDYDNQKLPLAEHKRMTGIKKDISEAEKIIDKKIKNIGF
ncbi:hypothetical protein A3A95_04155 [Candidatus Nomurabacteria bacterium RIFCSPLOWO2_01_FULL_39_18]|uniref:Cohesin domain-containing protein n=1 Tax=Candidatus Nomurabacteria bacterium RIFCSPHIGHO2_01_FULL_40_24b TaxID=1801739 RepID=A0A1F6V6N2_9BACT|nr:MAG: hypothetical protein A2647_04365 [Candidatus Nomurabacteria bacterium RIFCSPHIGHO2_01_FULL_40_24b]OGI89292.1 MAG: hypothetical protein A3A95_04155 [Candidatus Nomurabacteria bacterium RIFCSPLOWO2_01_FULL_39_18]